jgi:hypothetical protein
MLSYRCYLLDNKDHITAAIDLEANELYEALDQALVILNEHTEHSIEIWQGNERLYRTGRKAPPSAPRSPIAQA